MISGNDGPLGVKIQPGLFPDMALLSPMVLKVGGGGFPGGGPCPPHCFQSPGICCDVV